MKVEELIARICHIAWCAYQIGVDQHYNEDPTPAQIASNIDAIRVFHSGMTAEENHENWIKYKISNDWRHGLVKDEEAKTHPDLVPFDQLPLVEQRKDEMDLMCRRAVRKLLDEFGI